MHTIRVGELLVPGRTAWPEQNDFHYYDAGYELRVFMARPTRDELRGVKEGPWEFAVTCLEGILFLCFRCGRGGTGLPWSDASYSWHLVPQDRRVLPPATTEESRALLQVLVVDAATGRVAAIKAITLSPDCTRVLNQIIADQVSAPFDPAAHRQTVERILRRYFTEQLVSMALARCIGGE